MKNWIARSLGLCALAGALFAPVAKADGPATTRGGSMVQSCTLVNCAGNMVCCNHCQVRYTVCATGD